MAVGTSAKKKGSCCGSKAAKIEQEARFLPEPDRAVASEASRTFFVFFPDTDNQRAT
jgi:hypothetical protein